MNDTCGVIMPILRIVAYLLKIIQWVIPALLIVFATFDFIKATTSNEDKDMEKSKTMVAKRLIYALVVFLVPVVIKLLFNLVSNNISGGDYSGPAEWIGCFNDAFNQV